MKTDSVQFLRLGVPGLVSIRRIWFLLACCILCGFLFLSIFAPWLTPHDPNAQMLLERNQGFSSQYWLGTDYLGRDNLSRLVMGTRVSLIAGSGGLVCALVFGGLFGFLAVTAGGIGEYLFFSFIDLLRTVPGVLLALLLTVAFGSGLVPVTVALGLVFAPIFARIARAVYRREMAADYVTYSQVNGASKFWVLKRHIAPNVLGAFATQAGIIFPRCIVTESVLSFLGLGVSPDTPTWGRMIALASRYIEDNTIGVLAPVLALSLLTWSTTTLSNTIRRKTDALRRGEITVSS